MDAHMLFHNRHIRIMQNTRVKPANGWRYPSRSMGGRDNAALQGTTSSHANRLKTRREASHHASHNAFCRGSGWLRPGVRCRGACCVGRRQLLLQIVS